MFAGESGMKNAQQLSTFQKFLKIRMQTIRELLNQRDSLKQELKEVTAKFAKLLKENATQLEELGYEVKDAALGDGASGKNLRLDDENIKKQLIQILSGKQLSVPSICKHLHIARSRFTAFEKRHKGFLGKKGKGKLTVYFLKNANA
jgi:hypothetical protein